MKKFIIIITLVFFNACASVHYNQFAEELSLDKSENPKNKDLKISTALINKLCSEYFGMVNLTFENKTDKWIRIKGVKVYFKDELIEQNVKITSGADILHWKKPMMSKLEIDDFNRKLLMGSLAVLGAGISSFSSDKYMEMAGGAVLLGSLTSLSVNEYNKHIDTLENSRIFPENHLLYEDFVIPPGLFTKKWLLLNTQSHEEIPYIKNVFLEIEEDNGTIRNYKIKLRNRSDKPVWQKNTWKKNKERIKKERKEIKKKQKKATRKSGPRHLQIK